MAFSSFARSCSPQVGLNMQVSRFSPRWPRAPSIMLSITVIRLRALVSWKVRTIPARATDDAEVLSSLRPSKDQCAPVLAEVGLSKPVIRLKNVVLPAPLGPISAVMMPRCTSRWSTWTAVMPPKLRMMLSTSRIGSGLAEPGLRRRRRPSGPRAPPGRPVRRTCRPTVVCSDIEAQLPLVAEDSLWSEDHQQHQRDTDADPGELCGLGGVHDAVGHHRVGGALDEDADGEEQDRCRGPGRRPSPRRPAGARSSRRRSASGPSRRAASTPAGCRPCRPGRRTCRR